MRRRSLFFAVGMLVCLICGVAGILIALMRHEPDWYAAAAVPPDADRAQLSNEIKEAFSDLDARIHNEREWGGKFTAAQLNCYFEDGLSDDFKLDATLPPDTFSEPR